MKWFGWWWYPLAVGGVIIATGYGVWGTGVWSQLQQAKRQVDENALVLSQLQTKLDRLQGLDPKVVADHLNWLLTVLPAVKDFPGLLTQMQSAASASGAPLVTFSGQAGEVAASKLDVTLAVVDIKQLWQVIDYLEHSLPLVKVQRVQFVPGRGILEVEQLWQPLARVSANPASPIPSDVTAGVASLQQRLQDYFSRPTGEVRVGSEVNPDPFGQVQLE